jgi:hypothetical protein
VPFDGAPPKTPQGRKSSILKKLEIIKLRLLYRKTLAADNPNLADAKVIRRATNNHDVRHIISPAQNAPHR